MYKFEFSVLFIVVVFCSCSRPKQNPPQIYYQPSGSEQFNDQYTLKKVGSVSFPLDSATSFTSKSISTFNENGIEYFSLLNAFNQTIYVYDLSTKSLVEKISLEKISTNGVKPNGHYLSHYIKNKDTIIVCDSWHYRIFLLNNHGEVRHVYNIPFPGKDKFIVGLEAETERPMLVKDDKLYITGDLLDYSIPDQTKIKNIIAVDLKTNVINRYFSRPELYNRVVWSGDEYRLFNTFNSKTNKFIYSYAADPFIYETNNSGYLKKHYVGSKFFKKILPYKWEKDFKMNDELMSKLVEHDYTTPQFFKIIYDKYNDVYYRSALLPLTKDEYYDPQKRTFAKESLIIIDSKFNKIGEIQLPEKKYLKNMYFLTREGLNIALVPSLQTNEAQLTFDTFKLIKK